MTKEQVIASFEADMCLLLMEADNAGKRLLISEHPIKVEIRDDYYWEYVPVPRWPGVYARWEYMDGDMLFTEYCVLPLEERKV